MSAPAVLEDIPQELRPAAEAALAWVNRERGARFKLTGLVDVDEAVGGNGGEMGLVLCQDEVCIREQVRVERAGDGYRVSAVEAAPSSIPPLLDPPVGVRRDWLDRQLDRHAFVVLLFYRGLW